MIAIARGLFGVALATALGTSAFAQPAYPTGPITMIIGFAPGGPSDIVGRLIANAMGSDLGQPVVIENIAGAGGTIGHARFAQARPDGYTLLLGGVGQATVPTLFRRLSFDPIGSMEPVGLVNQVPMTIVARRTFTPTNLAEFVVLARREGDRLNLGNAGVGSTSHLCGLLLMSALGSSMTQVPYRGSALVLNDLVAGTLDVGCDQSTNTAEQIRGGTIRAYAVTTDARVPSLGDLPTTIEAGLPAMRMSGWNMVFAPSAAPRPIIERLNRALLAALRDETVGRRLAELGSAPVSADLRTPEAARAFWMSEIERWRPLILAAGQFAD